MLISFSPLFGALSLIVEEIGSLLSYALVFALVILILAWRGKCKSSKARALRIALKDENSEYGIELARRYDMIVYGIRVYDESFARMSEIIEKAEDLLY